MSGTIKRIPDGRYRAYYTAGSGPARTRHTKIVISKRAGQAWLLEQEQVNGSSNTRAIRNCYFVDYFKMWYKLFKAPVISAATKMTYKLTYQHLKVLVPKMKMAQLNRTLLQSIFNQLGYCYSKETCRKHAIQVKACLANAQYDGLIRRNLMNGVVVTGNEERSRNDNNKYLSGDDFLKIRSYLFKRSYGPKDTNYLILAIISATGARVGEVIGLKWEDVDPERHQLRIQRSYDSAARKIKATKTVNAVRTIPLVDDVVRLLRLWHDNVKRGTGFIFASNGKGLPKASSINSAFHTLQRHLGIEAIHSPHTLRHTVASLLVARPELDVTYVSRLLGHSNPAITQRYYLRVLPGSHEKEDTAVLNTIAL